MSNKKLIKNLLATASTMAVLTAGSSAFAANVTTTADNVNLTTGANLSTNAAWVDTDSLEITGDHTVLYNKNNAVISAIKVSAAVANAGNVSENVTIGNITNNGGTMPLQFTAAKTVTLTGTVYTGLASADFNNTASILDITGDATITAAINDATGNNKGTVNINGAVTFNGVAIANGINTVVVSDANSLTLTNGTRLAGKLANGLTVNGTGSLILQGNTTSGDVTLADAGTLDVTGGANGAATAGDVTVDTTGIVNVSGIAGNRGTVGAVDLNAAGTLNVGAYGTAGNTTVTAAGKVNLTDANAVIGNVTLTTADSTLNLGGGTAGKITAAANKMGVVNVTGDVTVGQLGGAANAQLNTVAFAADSTVTIGANNSFVNAITTANAGEGVIKVGTANLTVGTVGALKEINFGLNNTTLTVTGTEFHTSVHAAGGNAPTGKVVFEKAVTMDKDATLGDANHRLASVTVDGVNAANGVVALGDSLVNVAAFKLTNAGKASLSSVGLDTMTIDADANGGSALTISNNDKDIKVASIGATNAVTTLTLEGSKDVTVAAGGASKATTLTFKTTAKDATFTVDALDNIAAFDAESAGAGTIAFRDTSALGGNLGSAADKHVKAVNFVGTVAKTLNLANHETYGASVLADTADLLTVANAGNAANTTYGGFGAEKARLLDIGFVANPGHTATVKGEVFSKNLSIDNTAVVFEKTVSGVDDKATGISLTHANATATFKTGAHLLHMPVTTTAANQGKLVFEGDHEVGKIGADNSRVASVSFTGTEKTATLTADVYAANVAGSVNLGNKNTVKAKDDLTIGGQLAGTDTTFDVASNTVTLANTGALTGTVTVKAKNTAGKLGKVSANGLAVAPAAKLAFEFSGDRVEANTTFSGYLNFLDSHTLDLDTLNQAITTKSRSTKWTFVKNAAGTANLVDLVVVEDSAAFGDFLKKAGASERAQALGVALVEATPTGDALALVNRLDLASEEENADTMNRLVAKTASTIAATENVSLASAQIFNDRASGVSSGDEDGKLDLGVWVSGFGSQSKQKARKGDAGFNGKVLGGSFGVDTAVSEATTFGIGAVYAKTEMKFKDAKSGDKLKSDNMFFSIYGKHELNDSWFLQGNAGFGTGKVTSTAKRRTGTAAAAVYETATGKYDSTAFSVEAHAGYKVKVADNAGLTPTVGVRYVHVNDGGYTETGKSGQNFTVTKRAADRFTGIVGATVDTTLDMGGNVVTPEAHGFVNYDFKSKNPKVDARLNGLSTAIDLTAAKAAKVSYRVGASVSAKTDMLEFGIGYDARLADKFVAHQGVARVKVEL